MSEIKPTITTKEENEQLINEYKQFKQLTKSYDYTFRYFLDDIAMSNKRLIDCNELDISRFLDKRAHTNGSYNNMLSVLRGQFAWLYNKDKHLPVKKWKAPEFFDFIEWKDASIPTYDEDDVWTEEEILLAIQTCDHPRDKALIAVGYDLAARPHELMDLHINNIVLKEKYAEVRLKDHSNPRGRVIPITFGYPYLLAWMNAHPFKDNNSSPLWVRVKGTPSRMSTEGLNKLTKRLKAKLVHKIKKPFNPYCMFCHSRLSNLSETDGVNTEDLRNLRGWSLNSRMPSRYLHPSGKGTRNRLLELAGIEKRDIKQKESILKPKKCYKCNELNPADAKYCKCGFALSEEAYQEVKQEEEDLKKSVQTLQTQVDNIVKMLAEQAFEHTPNLPGNPEILAQWLKILGSKVRKPEDS